MTDPHSGTAHYHWYIVRSGHTLGSSTYYLPMASINARANVIETQPVADHIAVPSQDMTATNPARMATLLQAHHNNRLLAVRKGNGNGSAPEHGTGRQDWQMEYVRDRDARPQRHLD